MLISYLTYLKTDFKQLPKQFFRWKEFIRTVTHLDKLAAIAGFLPLAFVNFIKRMKPQFSSLDLVEVKLAIVDVCAHRYDVYRKKCATALEIKKRYKILNTLSYNVSLHLCLCSTFLKLELIVLLLVL